MLRLNPTLSWQNPGFVNAEVDSDSLASLLAARTRQCRLVSCPQHPSMRDDMMHAQSTLLFGKRERERDRATQETDFEMRAGK
jgi:hypothetical protein